MAQYGLTLVELLISMAVGMFVVVAATALLVSSKSGHLAQSDHAQILDTGRYATEIIARTVRQASQFDASSMEDGSAFSDAFAPAVIGLDAKSLKSRNYGLTSPVAKSINGSDVLAIRFAGSGHGENGDGAVLNCAGFGVGITADREDDDDARGWSIFYVAEDSAGEPELYCKYQGNDSWAAQAIARGVESFQVLYALDLDGDGVSNTFLSATAIDAMDNGLNLVGRNAAERASDKLRKSHWRKVVAVKVALLIRGSQSGSSDGPAMYDLFGPAYADAHAAGDPGVRIKVSALPKAVRPRVRRVFTSTIQLRNLPGGAPAW